ncbi:hypothetical protein IFM89_020175 [Coptis chinensis]|uniref:Galactose oxidase/kelch repeat superfamily protein n=1 Tax=Coptis chinensis TaxID=261450 RepID=A0A835LMW0_9MAGN|nr:hypothetical protein IFM89_020175 [Coptis chinensis]
MEYFRLKKCLFVILFALCPPKWEECSSIASANMTPAGAIVDGMVYALGSLDSSYAIHPWAEVFDLSSKIWIPLPEDRSRYSRGSKQCSPRIGGSSSMVTGNSPMAPVLHLLLREDPQKAHGIRFETGIHPKE